MRDRLVSLVLPVHTQGDHIGSVVRDYAEALAGAGIEAEVLLVPNASSDDSVEACRSLAETYPGVRVVESGAGGWGRNVRLGLGDARGDVLCYTNSARTAAQDLVLMLLYAAAYPKVVVKANRKIRDHWMRRLGSLLYNLECRALFDLSYWDINGTPKVFPRSFSKLLALTRDDDLIDVEFTIICRREGYPMVEVPIFSHRRHGGESTMSVGSAARLYWGAYRLWRDMR